MAYRIVGYSIADRMKAQLAVDALNSAVARRIADNGADQLLKGAANPGLQLGDLIDTGHIVTTALRDSARMLPEHLADPYTRLHALERAAQETRQGPVAG